MLDLRESSRAELKKCNIGDSFIDEDGAEGVVTNITEQDGRVFIESSGNSPLKVYEEAVPLEEVVTDLIQALVDKGGVVLMYDNLKKFADKKGIVATKMAEKKAYAEGAKKGKALSTAERNALVDQMLKDLGYLSN